MTPLQSDRVVDFDAFTRRIDGGDRVLPHNLDAERSVLGAVLLHSEVLAIASAIITASDFFREAHRRLFVAMTTLQGRGDAIDMVTLLHELGRLGDLDTVGGPAYIASLIDGVPYGTNVENHARIVKELATRRRVIQTATKILAASYELDADTNAIATAAQRDLAFVIEAAHEQRPGLDEVFLSDATDVAAEGQKIAAEGVPYLVEGLIAAYGMLGMLVAYAKVGKTSFALALAAAVARGLVFLDRKTRQCRVLVIAAEDPPEYTAWLSRHLGTLPRESMTFYRRALVLDAACLAAIVTTVQAGGYGLVLIASWQAVVRGLLRDENDNAGAVRVVEDVKAAARITGVPWLIDAHAGKGEDQTDDADPSKAMRGASSAAGAADYTLSLRYTTGGPFGTRRRLAGKGRFVAVGPLLLDFNVEDGTYSLLGTSKDTMGDTTWRLIAETGALTTGWQTAVAIAKAAGLVGQNGRVSTTGRRQVIAALLKRDGVRTTTENHRGQTTTMYARLDGE